MGRPPASYRVGRTLVANEDLSGLRRREKLVYKDAYALISALAVDPFVGYELRDEWEGARSLHFGRDQYRLIWQVNAQESEVIVLRVGRKTNSRGATIYDEPRPRI